MSLNIIFTHYRSSILIQISPTFSTVFDAKRLIGRKFADAEVQSDMKHWPFKIIDKDTKPIIEVEYRGEAKQFTPEEISSMILLKMKETAEAYLGTTVVNAGSFSSFIKICRSSIVTDLGFTSTFSRYRARLLQRFSASGDERCRSHLGNERAPNY